LDVYLHEAKRFADLFQYGAFGGLSLQIPEISLSFGREASSRFIVRVFAERADYLRARDLVKPAGNGFERALITEKPRF